MLGRTPSLTPASSGMRLAMRAYPNGMKTHYSSNEAFVQDWLDEGRPAEEGQPVVVVGWGSNPDLTMAERLANRALRRTFLARFM